MRQIKFRGKRIDNGEWVYGSLLLINNKAYINPSDSGDLEDIDFGLGFIEVATTTVCQFTGLLDKNGKEIIEGDILTDGKSRFYVKWSEGASWVADRSRNPMDCFYLDALLRFKRVRIIGNIHDK